VAQSTSVRETTFSKKIVVPNLVGLKVRDAQIVLTSAGFNPARVRYVESYEPPNYVVEQNPPRGHLIDSQAPIILSVAKYSMVRYLPTVYQTDGVGGENSFLKRYMWIFHHLLDSVVEKIENLPNYFQPYKAPEDFLPWLASWMGLTLDENWPPLKKRQTLRDAAYLYSARGTRKCIETLIDLFTGVKPEVRENTWPYKGFRVGISSIIGVDSVILPPMNLANCFMVYIPIRYGEVSQEMLVKIHQIIQSEKPAHTAYFLKFLEGAAAEEGEAFFTVGVDSFIGSKYYEYIEKFGPVE
jgi:phage tail-like protein